MKYRNRENGYFVSIQHLFAMFGSTVLVPFLTGLNPSVALISSGLGTLAFLLITKGRSTCLSRIIIRLYRTDYNSKNGRWTGSSNAWWVASRACVYLNLNRIKKSGSKWISEITTTNRSWSSSNGNRSQL